MARSQRKSNEVSRNKGVQKAKAVVEVSRRYGLQGLRVAKVKLPTGNKKSSKEVALDMLAEVATASASMKKGVSNKDQLRYETRQKNMPHSINEPAPVGNDPESLKDVMRRVSQGEWLNLSQIRVLSYKLLINVFAEFTSDEIRRSYTYSCFLMPDKCKQKFNSFGNETSARVHMKNHLLDHITKLISDENDQNKSRKKFIAEPVSVRKKRLESEQKSGKSRRGSTASSAKKSPSPSKIGRGRAKVAESPLKQITSPVRSPSKLVSRSARNLVERENLTHTTEVRKVEIPIVIKQEPIDLDEEPEEISETFISDDEEESVPEPTGEIVEEEPVLDNVEQENDGNTVIYVVQEEVIIGDDGQMTQVNESEVVGQDEDLMLDESSQPLHDHSYSFSNAADENCQNSESEVVEEEEQQEQQNIQYTNDMGLDEVVIELGPDVDSSELERIATKAAHDAHNAGTDILQSILSAVESANIQTGGSKSFQNFPTIQSKGRKKSSHAILASEEELYAIVDENPDDEKDLVPGSQDWERKMAMNYIRHLRTKKKDEKVSLVCKICKDKTFTAQATLMYHYRSHAGIKPFTCAICNTSFTRQHSLNYHMLIHNNRSRFTCSDCGRKFRHPSHFKEHMRRHTGETPFECDDCGVRFKTRNTYKRHLKTRHGKLLTATGIQSLTEEEFNKVRTNPKRRVTTIPLFNRQRDMETQWPEPEHIGLEEADAAAIANLANEVYDNRVVILEDDGEEQGEDDDDETAIEVYGDPSLGQTIKVLTADGQLIDVKVVERKPEYSLMESNNENEANEENEENMTLEDSEGTETRVLTSEDIQAVDLQPILECINNGDAIWE